MKYRADIDGLRALAVISVVLYHVGIEIFSGGFVGVDIFFVISGYVIAGRLLEVRDFHSIADFYVRRIRRIFPALFVTVVVTWLIATLLFLPAQLEDLSRSTLATALSASNFYFWKNSGYFDASAHLRPLLHTWSLAVEEQYYLVLPAMIYVIANFFKRRWAFFLLPVALVSFALSVYAERVAPTANFMLLPTRFWELLVGGLMIFNPLPQPASRYVREALGVLGLALIGFAILTFNDNTPFPGPNALFPCLGAALLIYVGEKRDQPTLATRLASLRPLVWVGLISYSFYLVHWPIIVFSKYLLLREFSPWESAFIFALGLLLGYLSYRYVEQPFRKPNTSVTVLMYRFSAGVAAMALIGYVGMFTRGIPQRFPMFVEQTIPGKEAWLENICFLSASQTWKSWDAERCSRTGHSGRKIFLWGDSFAAHYVPGLISRAAAPPVNVIQYTAAGCRPILSYESYAQPNCHDFNQHALSLIKDMDVQEVVISARWVKLGARGLDDLRDTVKTLKDMGVVVVVIGQSPEFPIDVQILGYRHDVEHGSDSWHISFDPKINADLQKVISGLATFIDPISEICNGTLCPYVSKGDYLYADFGHFSSVGSKLAVEQYFGKTQTAGRPIRTVSE